MSNGYEARVVRAFVNLDGHVQEVRSPSYTTMYRLGGEAHVSTALPVDGEHYGWDLEPILERGLSSRPQYASDVRVCPNAQHDEADHHTIWCGPTEMIKLDCGYWGAFARDREYSDRPQRDFGLIMGHDVWLCRFHSGGPVDHGEKLDHFPADSLIRQFITLVENTSENFGFGIELVTHATAPSSPATAGLAGDDSLRIIFPDIHLPEKWPDLPSDADRHPNEAARTTLQRNLRLAQRKPSTMFNTLSEDDQETIQQRLESIHNDHVNQRSTTPDWRVTYQSGTEMMTVPGEGPVPVPIFSRTDFTPQQVLAEKAILDRRLMSQSCWFVAPNQAETVDGVASPAVDLVNLLCAIEAFQNQVGSSRVKVYQVGDLYELWMNHEFLYREYPVSQAEAGSPATLGIIRATGQLSDDFQYRMDKDWWRSGDAGLHPIKRYPFHEWPYDGLIHRHQLYDSVGTLTRRLAQDEETSSQDMQRFRGEVRTGVTRLRELLRERVASVKNFSLSDPQTSGSRKLRQRNGELFQGSYRRRNARGQAEYKWNRMIIDKLNALGCQKIYGNHDGYRGDPVLNTTLAGSDQAESWISENGIWMEHSHRWDDYNRDGMAFGAGVTNFVYYYYYDRIRPADHVRAVLRIPWLNEPQDLQAFIPGAAQWFLMVNFGRRGQFNGVRPFGIYVNGHTHNPDLMRIQFHLTTTAEVVRGVEEVRRDMRDAWQEFLNLPENLLRQAYPGYPG